MKLSTRARYALRATTELALSGAWRGNKDGPDVLPLSLIGERQDIDVQYLRQIFSKLRRKGFVRSVHGRTGGYSLAKPPARINAYQIITAMDEDLGLVACVKKPSSCKRVKECPTYPLYCRLAEQQKELLSKTTLAELADRCPGRGRIHCHGVIPLRSDSIAWPAPITGGRYR